MTEKEKDSIPELKGRGLEIGRSGDGSTFLGALATRSAEAMDSEASESTLIGKGLNILRKEKLSDTEGKQVYLSTKNGSLYEIVDDRPVGEGLVRLRNRDNKSIATLAADVLDDPNRFTLYDGDI